MAYSISIEVPRRNRVRYFIQIPREHNSIINLMLHTRNKELVFLNLFTLLPDHEEKSE